MASMTNRGSGFRVECCHRAVRLRWYEGNAVSDLRDQIAKNAWLTHKIHLSFDAIVDKMSFKSAFWSKESQQESTVISNSVIISAIR